MKRGLVLVTVLGALLSVLPDAARAAAGGAVITGRVVESSSSQALEYAQIIASDLSSGRQITGTTSDRNGSFRLSGLVPGIYRIDISFIGFETRTDTLVVTAAGAAVDLGTVRIEPTVIQIEGVEVNAKKPVFEFKIDKKVIDVSRNYTAAAGTAVDVLENVPSVTVDIEGNVSLRGSTNFTVLVDGRPTMLESNDALQQIPASTIDRIEVITNPSAKYDPGGISGIINVQTKKNRNRGVNGIVNAGIGQNSTYSGDGALNYRLPAAQIKLGVDYANRVSPGDFESENRTTYNDTVTSVVSRGDTRWRRNFAGFKSGIELFLTPRDAASVAVQYRTMKMENESRRDYDEWTDPGDTAHYAGENFQTHGGDRYFLNLDYMHAFKEKDHRLSLRAMAGRNLRHEQSSNELRDPAGALRDGQRSTGDGPSTRLMFNLNYTLPRGEKNKIESGYQSDLERGTAASGIFSYDTASGGYEYAPEYSHTLDFRHDIHSAFATYAGGWGFIGFQAGLRAEYTRRLISLVGEDDYDLARWDLYPTLHASCPLNPQTQIMTSYTRRVDRPRDYDLVPFETWIDAFNIRRGNPGLKPEFIDSYELGAQEQLGINTISLETYYRRTNNRIEHVRRVYSDKVMLSTVENAGTAHAFGSELMADIDPWRWLNLNLAGDVYQYRIAGVVTSDTSIFKNINWSLRMSTTFRITSATRLQFSGFYSSPEITTQGNRRGFISTNAALKQDLLGKTLTAAAQVRDIFRTSGFEYTSRGADFYSHVKSSRSAPAFVLGVNYNFNNYKPDRAPADTPESEEIEEFQ